MRKWVLIGCYGGPGGDGALYEIEIDHSHPLVAAIGDDDAAVDCLAAALAGDSDAIQAIGRHNADAPALGEARESDCPAMIDFPKAGPLTKDQVYRGFRVCFLPAGVTVREEDIGAAASVIYAAATLRDALRWIDAYCAGAAWADWATLHFRHVGPLITADHPDGPFIGQVFDRLGRLLYSSMAYATRDEAATECFLARPRAAAVSHCRAWRQPNGIWRPNGCDTRWTSYRDWNDCRAAAEA